MPSNSIRHKFWGIMGKKATAIVCNFLSDQFLVSKSASGTYTSICSHKNKHRMLGLGGVPVNTYTIPVTAIKAPKDLTKVSTIYSPIYPDKENNTPYPYVSIGY